MSRRNPQVYKRPSTVTIPTGSRRTSDRSRGNEREGAEAKAGSSPPSWRGASQLSGPIRRERDFAVIPARRLNGMPPLGILELIRKDILAAPAAPTARRTCACGRWACGRWALTRKRSARPPRWRAWPPETAAVQSTHQTEKRSARPQRSVRQPTLYRNRRYRLINLAGSSLQLTS